MDADGGVRLQESAILYELLSLQDRDELLQCLLIAAPRGGEARLKVLEEPLLVRVVDELLDERLAFGETETSWQKDRQEIEKGEGRG